MGTSTKNNLATRTIQYATRITKTEPQHATAVSLTDEAIANAKTTAEGRMALMKAVESGVEVKTAEGLTRLMTVADVTSGLSKKEVLELALTSGLSLKMSINLLTASPVLGAKATRDLTRDIGPKGRVKKSTISRRSKSGVRLVGTRELFAINWGVSAATVSILKSRIPGDDAFKERVLASFINPPKADFKASTDGDVAAICTSRSMQEIASARFLNKAFSAGEVRTWNLKRKQELQGKKKGVAITDYQKYTTKQVRSRLKALGDERLLLFMKRGCCKMFVQLLTGVCKSSSCGKKSTVGSEAQTQVRVGEKSNVYCPGLIEKNSRRFLKVDPNKVIAWAKSRPRAPKPVGACRGKEKAGLLLNRQLAQLNKENELTWGIGEERTYYFSSHGCAAEFHLRGAGGNGSLRGRRFFMSDQDGKKRCTPSKQKHNTVVLGGVLTRGTDAVKCAGIMSGWLDQVKTLLYRHNGKLGLGAWPMIGESRVYIHSLAKKCNIKLPVPPPPPSLQLAKRSSKSSRTRFQRGPDSVAVQRSGRPGRLRSNPDFNPNTNPNRRQIDAAEQAKYAAFKYKEHLNKMKAQAINRFKVRSREEVVYDPRRFKKFKMDPSLEYRTKLEAKAVHASSEMKSKRYARAAERVRLRNYHASREAHSKSGIKTKIQKAVMQVAHLSHVTPSNHFTPATHATQATQVYGKSHRPSVLDVYRRHQRPAAGYQSRSGYARSHMPSAYNRRSAYAHSPPQYRGPHSSSSDAAIEAEIDAAVAGQARGGAWRRHHHHHHQSDGAIEAEIKAAVAGSPGGYNKRVDSYVYRGKASSGGDVGNRRKASLVMKELATKLKLQRDQMKIDALESKKTSEDVTLT